MQQKETKKMTKKKSQVENLLPSYTGIYAMIAAQLSRTTEQMVRKEISTIVAVSLDYILQWTYDRARKGVRSVVYKVVEQI